MTDTPIITLDWIRQERARHKQALADLDAAERLLRAAPVTRASETPSPKGEEFLKLHGGKRRALLAIIAASPDGLTTPETIRAAVDLGVMDMTTANVSPKLSESRKQGYLELLDGGRWRITDRGREFLAAKQI